MRQKKLLSSSLLILGHRGSPKKEIENSIQSFQKAILDGADGVELDVHITKDEKIVVIHDFNTKRVFGVDAKIEEMSLSEIKAISSDIPTLKEVFDEVGSIYYDIEIKAEINFDRLLISNLSKELDRADIDQSKIAISSFNPMAMRHFYKMNKNKYPLGIIYDGPPTNTPLLLRHGRGRLFFPCDFLKPKWDIAVKEAKRHQDYKTIPWCVDAVENLDQILQINPEGIISNVPSLIVEALKEKGLR